MTNAYGNGWCVGTLYSGQIICNATASSQWINVTPYTGGTITVNYDTTDWSGGRYLDEKDGKLVAPKGKDLLLPDGTVIKVDDLGNYKIEDKDAKVVYEAARMREFNPFVNASDLLASFIRDVGALGITKEELSKLPIPLLINWLVVKAAEQDNDPVPDGIVPIAQHPALLQLMPKSEKAA